MEKGRLLNEKLNFRTGTLNFDLQLELVWGYFRKKPSSSTSGHELTETNKEEQGIPDECFRPTARGKSGYASEEAFSFGKGLE